MTLYYIKFWKQADLYWKRHIFPHLLRKYELQTLKAELENHCKCTNRKQANYCTILHCIVLDFSNMILCRGCLVAESFSKTIILRLFVSPCSNLSGGLFYDLIYCFASVAFVCTENMAKSKSVKATSSLLLLHPGSVFTGHRIPVITLYELHCEETL